MTELIEFLEGNIGKYLYYDRDNPRYIILNKIEIKDDVIELYSGKEPSLQVPIPFTFTIIGNEIFINYEIDNIHFLSPDSKKYLLELAEAEFEKLNLAFKKQRNLFFNKKISFWFENKRAV